MSQETNLVAYVTKYLMISGTPLRVHELVTNSLSHGYMVYGQPFSHDGQICQAMVLMDPRMKAVVDKALTMMEENRASNRAQNRRSLVDEKSL